MIEAVIKGFAISLLLIFSVGPIIFTILKQSINNGRAGGFSFVAGVWLSDLVWVILSNLFSEMVIKLLNFKTTIAISGSSFLLCMGIYFLFFKKVHLKDDENKIRITARTHLKLAASGFLINSLNPAIIIFWLTTATAVAYHTVQHRIVIFATCLILNSASDILKVVLAGKVRHQLNEKNIALINKISGSILIVFAAILILGTLFSTGNQ